MTNEEAQGLAEFIKDHDKRFGAKAREDGSVLLTQVSDGKTLEPVTTIDQYRTMYIERSGPGPTVQTAWDDWQRRKRQTD